MVGQGNYYNGYMVRYAIYYNKIVLYVFNVFIEYDNIVILDSPECAMQQLLTAVQGDELWILNGFIGWIELDERIENSLAVNWNPWLPVSTGKPVSLSTTNWNCVFLRA